MPDSSEFRNRLTALEFVPPLTRDGTPKEGAYYGAAQVLKVVSQGPNVPVRARNPLKTPLVRASGWTPTDSVNLDRTRSGAQSVVVVPREALAGQQITLLVE